LAEEGEEKSDGKAGEETQKGRGQQEEERLIDGWIQARTLLTERERERGGAEGKWLC
jgi:hypothetical protein